MAAEEAVNSACKRAGYSNSIKENASDHPMGKVPHQIDCSPFDDSLNAHPIFENDPSIMVKEIEWSALIDAADKEFAAAAYAETKIAHTSKGVENESSAQDAIIYFLRESDGSKHKVEAWSPSGSHELIHNHLSFADITTWINFLKEPCLDALTSLQPQLLNAFPLLDIEIGSFDNSSATIGDPFYGSAGILNSMGPRNGDQFFDVNLNADSSSFMESNKKDFEFIDPSLDETSRSIEFSAEPLFLEQSNGARFSEISSSQSGWNDNNCSRNLGFIPLFDNAMESNIDGFGGKELSWPHEDAAFVEANQQIGVPLDSEALSDKFSFYNSPLMDPFAAFLTDVPVEQCQSKTTPLQKDDVNLISSNFDSLSDKKCEDMFL